MTSTPTAAIYIIVLNWNNWPDTLACLESFEQVREPPHRVLVVDNGSDDGSDEQIRARYPDVELLQTGRNLGYAGGNNVGIRHALEQGAEYVCILNNDVTVAPDFLTRLVRALDQHPGAGIATPLIADMAQPERIWSLGAHVDQSTGAVTRLHAGEAATAWKNAAPFAVPVAPGSALLVRSAVFRSIGLFDEAFYLYYEEIDWCLRAGKGGFRIVAVPDAVVYHRVSAALGTTSPVIDYYMLRNELFFLSRHWQGLGRARVLTRAAVRDLASIAAYTVKPRKGQRLPHRNARLLALRDAALGRWGEMGPDVQAVCRREGR